MPSLWITVRAYHEDCHRSGKRVPILLTSTTSVFVELPVESPDPIIDPLLQGERASQFTLEYHLHHFIVTQQCIIF